MDKTIKILVLTNQQVLISEIEEVVFKRYVNYKRLSEYPEKSGIKPLCQPIPDSIGLR